MKIIYCIYFLFIGIFCSAQKAKGTIELSILDPSNFWSVLTDTTIVPDPNFNPYKEVISTWYKFGNDTVFNGIQVKTLLNNQGPYFHGWSVSGYLRQDGEKIYFSEGEREILLYDFGLSVGTTFKSAIHPDFSYVSRLDSVRDTTLNNTVRKIFYLTEYPDFDPSIKQKDVWIEGIGSITNGLLRQTMLGSPLDPILWLDYHLMCFHQNDELVYQMKRFKMDDNYTSSSMRSLLSPDKLWSTMKGPVIGCKSFFCASYYTRFSGDTIIDNNHYMKVLCTSDILMKNWNTWGFIREDQNHQVFYREINAKKECLLYDFNCKPGEILHLSNVCTGDYLVDSIATKIDNGISRKHYYLKYLSGSDTNEEWIEGIGSNFGILNGGGANHCMTGGGESLLCTYENDAKTYQSSLFPNYCYLSSEIINGIAPEKTVPQYLVYPNPVSRELFVRSPQINDGDFTLELYTVKGELVKTECLESGSNLHRIDVSSLKSGVYVVRVISASGKYSEEVIIKE